MWDRSHSVAIIFNGEIYNYRILAEDLKKDEFKFRTKSDTEVILNLYLRDQENLLEKFEWYFCLCALGS